MAATPRSCEKADYEYPRSAEVSPNFSVFVEPFLGWRHLTITALIEYLVKIDRGLLCQKYGVSLMASIQLDAHLFKLAPLGVAGIIVRPRRVGQGLPLLAESATTLTQAWQLIEMKWEGGTKRKMWLLTGTTEIL